MDTPIERYEHAGCIIELHYDDSPSNPLTDQDQPGQLFNWGDHDGRISIGGIELISTSSFEEDTYDDNDDWTGVKTLTVTEHFNDPEEYGPDALVVPLHFSSNNHGSGTASFDAADNDPENANCAWVITGKELADEWNGDREAARRYVLAACEEIANYCNGHVYGYIVTNPTGNEVDSLWNIYGFEYAHEEAERAADWYAKRETIERAYWAARGVVTTV